MLRNNEYLYTHRVILLVLAFILFTASEGINDSPDSNCKRELVNRFNKKTESSTHVFRNSSHQNSERDFNIDELDLDSLVDRNEYGDITAIYDLDGSKIASLPNIKCRKHIDYCGRMIMFPISCLLTELFYFKRCLYENKLDDAYEHLEILPNGRVYKIYYDKDRTDEIFLDSDDLKIVNRNLAMLCQRICVKHCRGYIFDNEYLAFMLHQAKKDLRLPSRMNFLFDGWDKEFEKIYYELSLPRYRNSWKRHLRYYGDIFDYLYMSDKVHEMSHEDLKPPGVWTMD